MATVNRHAPGWGNVLEAPVAPVQEQAVSPVVGREEIQPAVAVQVQPHRLTHRHRVRIDVEQRRGVRETAGLVTVELEYRTVARGKANQQVGIAVPSKSPQAAARVARASPAPSATATSTSTPR